MTSKRRDCHPLRLYSLHSQKGGVGKTSLAIAIAGLEALLNRRHVLLLDADMTGTCIADALGIPRTKHAGKKWLNDLLLAPPDQFLELTRLNRRRGRAAAFNARA